MGQAPHQGIMTGLGIRGREHVHCGMRWEAGLRAHGKIQQSFGQDSVRFRWSRRGCGLPLPVQERPGWCPSTAPLLATPLGRGWPLPQHSPDALVVSLRSPDCATIIANLAPPYEMSSVLDRIT